MSELCLYLNKKAYKFLKEYANSPIIPPTKEEALNRLRKLGIIDENGNSRSDIFVESGKTESLRRPMFDPEKARKKPEKSSDIQKEAMRYLKVQNDLYNLRKSYNFREIDKEEYIERRQQIIASTRSKE